MQHFFLRKLFVAFTLCVGFAITLYADDVNMTKYILNPSFESGTNDWNVTNMQIQSNSSFTKKAGSKYMEKWVGIGNAAGSCSVSQKIKGLPAGKYRMTVAAQNIQQDSPTAEQTGTTIYAGTVSTTVTVVSDYDVEFDAYGDVTIGFKAVNATGNYICVDNFRLYYTAPDLSLLKSAIPAAQKVITDSQKSAYAGLQPAIKAALENAIANAENATEETSNEDLQAYAFDLAEQTMLGNTNKDELYSLKQLTNKARSYLTRDMAADYQNALQTAYDAALAFLELTSDEAPSTFIVSLQNAYDDATASVTAKNALKIAITNANNLLSREGLIGADDLQEVVNQAEQVRDDAHSSPEVMTKMKTELEEATLLCRVNNPTSTSAVTVHTLSAVQGATVIFARASFSGASAKEQGFCWSENPEPTIFDNRSTKKYSDQGAPGVIYYMDDLKPATIYYVRAYAFTTGYRLSYGDVIKVATLPKGNTSGYYDEAGPDETTNARIRNAFNEALEIWNSVNSLDGFTPSVHYSAGTPTADCSYGGWIRMGASSSYQRTGTIMHEMLHGVGVIPGGYGWNNSIYREGGTSGIWLGPRVDRVIQFLENSSTAHLKGDDQHMWPYGINGAQEDTGQPMLYRGNGLVIQALVEDGLIAPNQNFAHPAYTFVQDDDTKYYIKSESADRGIATSYLQYVSGTTVRFAAATADEAFADDSYAWYITFNPKTCYYTFKNVASGLYLTMTSGTATATTTATTYQLLGSRIETTYNDFTFSGSSYWIVNSNNHNAMNATTIGATSAPFNHNNSATTQRWLLLTGEEVTRFAEAQGETVGVGAMRTTPTTPALRAQGSYGVIYITAIGAGQDVEVYTLDGRLLNRLYIQQDATAQVRAPRGLYLVGGQKVFVR